MPGTGRFATIPVTKTASLFKSGGKENTRPPPMTKHHADVVLSLLRIVGRFPTAADEPNGNED